MISFKIIHAYPHDTQAFTQGLTWSPDGKTLYESTGLYGESSIRRSVFPFYPATQKGMLEAGVFAEGITYLPQTDEILQLTWKEKTMFTYDPLSLQRTRTLPMGPTRSGEGWGVTTDGRDRLFVSDGTSYITVWDPRTFTKTGEISVMYRGAPVINLNALEWVQGTLLAHIWRENKVAVIHPGTGVCHTIVDISYMVPPGYEGNPDACANGMAWNPSTERLWMTGKLWNRLYECEIQFCAA